LAADTYFIFCSGFSPIAEVRVRHLRFQTEQELSAHLRRTVSQHRLFDRDSLKTTFMHIALTQ